MSPCTTVAALFIVTMLLVLMPVDGQWGAPNRVKASSNNHQSGDPDFHGPEASTSGERQEQYIPQSGTYKDRWMPTARPGFTMPTDIKRQVNEMKSNNFNKKRSSMGPQTMGSNTNNNDDEDMNEATDRSGASFYAKTNVHGTQKTLDKCFRQVSKFCSFRVMQENFAMFSECVYLMRHRVKSNCLVWAENHGKCAPDMISYCPAKDPPSTTECLNQQKSKLSAACLSSEFFRQMESGYDDFKKGHTSAEEGYESNHPFRKGKQKDNQQDDVSSKMEEKEQGPTTPKGNREERATHSEKKKTYDRSDDSHNGDPQGDESLTGTPRHEEAQQRGVAEEDIEYVVAKEGEKLFDEL